MKRLAKRLSYVLVFAALGLMAASASQAAERLADKAVAAGVPQTTFSFPDGTSAHILPTVQLQDQITKALGTRTLANVTYHGGRIMRTVNIYAIYWQPATLQTGAPTTIPTSYKTVLNRMLANYAGHSVANINTQYYEIISTVKYFHSGLGRFAGTYTDTAAYPASGCTDTATPGACVSDAQIRAEIEKVRVLKGWPTGFSSIYLLFTSSGEGSCIGSSCAYTHYCAYHSWYGSSTSPVIYGNEPYGNNSVCQPTALLPNPGTADSAATAARHEISEATTDPQLNAWWDSASGEETSDKCNFNYGTRTWDFVSPNFLANYMWGGYFFLLQMEYSNHKSACTQEGP